MALIAERSEANSAKQSFASNHILPFVAKLCITFRSVIFRKSNDQLIGKLSKKGLIFPISKFRANYASLKKYFVLTFYFPAGPLAHLPPWQQRTIRLQRKKLLEEQVAKGNQAAKIQLEKLLKIIEQDKLEVEKNQAGNQAVSTTTEMPKLSKKEKKSSKAKKAQPQMMKFSQWATSGAPEVEVIEPETKPEDQVITVTSDLSDEDFSKMLENLEPENLFEKKEVSDDDFFSMIDFLG